MAFTCRMEPPATPPWRSSTSDPGLFTSNDRMTIICGGDVKSLCGYAARSGLKDVSNERERCSRQGFSDRWQASEYGVKTGRFLQRGQVR